MNGEELELEAEPFELDLETWRRGRGSPNRPRPPSRHWPRRPRVGARVLVAQPCPSCEQRKRSCETVLVLEGFAAGQNGLAAHHGPMLQRLASFLSRAPLRPRSIEVEARNPAGRVDRRAEEAARFLRMRLRGPLVATAASRSRGPERVEIRFCFPNEE
jgi:hypothetical protein